jgi:hypothetical protein
MRVPNPADIGDQSGGEDSSDMTTGADSRAQKIAKTNPLRGSADPLPDA